ncbi:MAG TPA: hypothetical protein VFS37_14380 [Conexibacter sp.]|nr:hypothetical protein [Conexibacter sp.]
MDGKRRDVEENDIVRFLAPIGRWPAGAEGTAISAAFADVMLVEISDRDGCALDFVDAPVELLEVTWLQGVTAAV